jgi:hypothetical protein
MRVLLDEHLDHRLRRSFDPSVEVVTVAEQGWKGKKNGELLHSPFAPSIPHFLNFKLPVE